MLRHHSHFPTRHHCFRESEEKIISEEPQARCSWTSCWPLSPSPGPAAVSLMDTHRWHADILPHTPSTPSPGIMGSSLNQSWFCHRGGTPLSAEWLLRVHDLWPVSSMARYKVRAGMILPRGLHCSLILLSAWASVKSQNSFQDRIGRSF